MLWKGVNLCSHSAFIVQEDLPGVESAIFQSVIQESLHDIGGGLLISQSQVMTSAGVCICSTKSLSSEFMRRYIFT